MENNFDVIIIGAGVVGCSIAFALSKRGLKTLNVDSLPASGYGSTSHSSAVVRPIYSHVTSCAIAHECRFIWNQWADFLEVEDDRGMASYNECGGMVLIRQGEEHLYEANLTAMSEVGVEYQLLNAKDLEELYPGISLKSYGPPRPIQDKEFGEPTGGAITSALLVPASGYVSDPQLASHNLQIAAENRGAAFLFNRKVASIPTPHDCVSGVLLETGETINSNFVINATGPHSGIVNEMAGVRDQLKITTKPLRHEVVYLPATARHFENGGRFLVDTDTGVYQRPDGQDMLIGSADPECDPHVIVDPDNYDSSFTEQWTLQAHRAAQRFPEMGISNTARGTVGIYDVSDDWIPIYDKCDLPGFYLAIGTSGNQFKNAPLIGELMAEIMTKELEGRNHDEEPATLRLKHIDRGICLDFYSRNREVQSTYGVMA
jgi:sarcosine oxidase, subunit beta